MPSGPGLEASLFKYRLYETDGSEAVYALTIKPGEIIRASGNRKLRVVDVVPVDEKDSPYVGLLRVEGVSG